MSEHPYAFEEYERDMAAVTEADRYDDRPTAAELAADEADYQDDVDWAEYQSEKDAGWHDDARVDPWAGAAS